jgi:hypothetical protein
MMGRTGVALGLLLGLAACSGDDAWFGGSEEPPLPGERVSVMLLERDLIADPNLSDLPIELPPPLRNDSWPQNGGVATHAMHHLAAADQLSLAWRADIGAGASDAMVAIRENHEWKEYLLPDVYFSKILFLSRDRILASGSYTPDRGLYKIRRYATVSYSSDGGGTWSLLFNYPKATKIYGLTALGSGSICGVGDKGLIILIRPSPKVL